ncbi:TetR/AcrR family transcriptional regulator [Nocardia brasiliensis]|uniref:TetR/AcrR family transcriptional regulator n=1 Tax=Nocardia brasiliensis TaxID=37326 RepID=UPI002454182B|nr:TetR/AcrR family transcriptional regulator [Nocardia brasiliensis]
MASETTAPVDPARSISLLWGTRTLPKRGPRHALEPTQVVTAAVAVADADADIAQLSMRRVAERLGVGTMSLYTYVASRDELVEAMLDTIYTDVVKALRDRSPTGWRDGLHAVADLNWRMYQQHPWALQVFTGRPALGPNAIAKYDLELSVLDGIGLDDVQMDSVLTLVHTHVEGVARRRLDAEHAVRRTGITDQQWWEAVTPALSEVFDPGQFPIADRVGRAAGEAHQAGHDPEHAYAFGLERVLDGVAALLAT